MTDKTTEPLLETGDAARLLGLSVERVRQLADSGALRIAVSTASGRRLFERADVEALVAKRSA